MDDAVVVGGDDGDDDHYCLMSEGCAVYRGYDYAVVLSKHVHLMMFYFA